MKIAILHTAEALEDPPDLVLPQLDEALRKLGHEPLRVVVDDDAIATGTSLRRMEPDLVFNLAESFGGKSALESSVAALLNLLGLRYTGSSPAGLLLAGDKGLTRKVLGFHGIRSPEFAIVYRGDVDWAGKIKLPVIVKPAQEDASIGISSAAVVNDLGDLLRRIDEIRQEHGQPAVVEQFIDGREFYVGVLGNESATALPPIELDFSGFPPGKPRIASWEAKWGDEGTDTGAEFHGTRSIFPQDLSDESRERLSAAALQSYSALRLRDYARVDLRLTPEGEACVLEVNPNCYLEKSGEFARAAAKSGLDYDALIARIVELATARYAR